MVCIGYRWLRDTHATNYCRWLKAEMAEKQLLGQVLEAYRTQMGGNVYSLRVNEETSDEVQDNHTYSRKDGDNSIVEVVGPFSIPPSSAQ